MQAIQTHYLPPTNHRPARIVAKAVAKRLVLSIHRLDDILDESGHSDSGTGERREALAARMLATELGWLDGYRLESGTLPNGDGCHVRVAAGRE